ncbi:hypothetical protein [Spartinivicinus ruber]|uniref:hypothetical protein n=1 Tax=Spartinivicinus ruber TaxID=2683272 RepID=UPI0013D2BDAF|nr:hypothetical protein [Spartinivicinus ruber]
MSVTLAFELELVGRLFSCCAGAVDLIRLWCYHQGIDWCRETGTVRPFIQCHSAHDKLSGTKL